MMFIPFVSINGSFLSVAFYSIIWTYHNLMISFPADGYFGCFQFRNTINKAALNICIYVFGKYVFISLR